MRQVRYRYTLNFSHLSEAVTKFFEWLMSKGTQVFEWTWDLLKEAGIDAVTEAVTHFCHMAWDVILNPSIPIAVFRRELRHFAVGLSNTKGFGTLSILLNLFAVIWTFLTNSPPPFVVPGLPGA